MMIQLRHREGFKFPMFGFPAKSLYFTGNFYFKKMQFDVNEPNLFDTYPQLARRKGFFDDEEFLRFLILYYTKDSPYWEERDLQLKMQLCLQEMGITEDDPIFIRHEYMDEGVMDQIFELFRMYGDLDFEMWMSARLSLAHMNAKLRDPYGMKDLDRTRTMKEIDSIRDKVLALEARLFPDDPTVKSLLSERAAAKSLTGYAEKYAEQPEVS